jgi:hypothetical protein
LGETFFILGRNEQNMIENVCSILSSCQILMKLEFSQYIFEKYSNIKFHENQPSGSQTVVCRWTDMKLIVAFHNFVNVPNKPKNAMMIISGSILATTCNSKIITHKK